MEENRESRENMEFSQEFVEKLSEIFFKDVEHSD